MAVRSGTAARAPAFVTGHRVAVLIFLAPKLYFLFLGAFDASLAHFHIVLYLGFRKLSVLPEDDVEAHPEYAQAYED